MTTVGEQTRMLKPPPQAAGRRHERAPQVQAGRVGRTRLHLEREAWERTLDVRCRTEEHSELIHQLLVRPLQLGS